MPGLLVIGYQQQSERGRAAGGEVQSVSEGRGTRRGRRAEGASQRDGAAAPARSSRAARRAWCCRDRQPHKAIAALASRSSSSPNGIRTRLRAGEDLPVRLTYENRPLAGALVVAINRAHPSEKLPARTRRGRARPAAPPAGTVAGQGRAHDSRARRHERRLGELLGVAHVRAAVLDGADDRGAVIMGRQHASLSSRRSRSALRSRSQRIVGGTRDRHQSSRRSVHRRTDLYDRDRDRRRLARRKARGGERTVSGGQRRRDLAIAAAPRVSTKRFVAACRSRSMDRARVRRSAIR